MRAALAVGLLAAVVFVVLAVLVTTPFGIAFDGAVRSFPSGHAMVSIAFYGALAVIGCRASSTHLRLRPNPIGGPPCSNAR